jgi:type II secretory pathway pseudopilin PulG
VLLHAGHLLADGRGFSISEVTTTLAVLVILTTVATPAIHEYVDRAQLIRATSDVSTLMISLIRLFSDVGFDRDRPGGWSRFELLVGAGAAPVAGSDASTAWTTPVGAPLVGLLDDQLIRNTPDYARRGRFGWRGPYVQRAIGADPWGMRYAVNIGAGARPGSVTFVLSAGPDGVVSVPFDANGIPAGHDDIVAVVSSGGAP